MKPFLVLVLLVPALLLVSCSRDTEKINTAAIDKAVSQLETTQDKKEYLLAIRADDQAVHQGNRGAYLKVQYGENSPEYQNHVDEVATVDKRNLAKIQSYLATHGYPEWLKVGYEAAQTPFQVIQHSTDTDLRNSYFEQFYVAYRKGDLAVDNLALYLKRTHEQVTGESMSMEGSYTVEEELDTLVKALQLTEAQRRAEKATF